ncbi:MAG: bifunctional UDP-N-acetylglucosamine diphosphorylase/glucosamine-1-phosphate N-acetyltransferase GlmU [Alphaproteobacteria bacterium]
MTDNHKHKFAAVILAAGKGTRMKSDLPKVMHKLAGKSLVSHVLDTVDSLHPEKKVLVIAPNMDSVAAVAKGCDIAIQDKQLGTGHAVGCSEAALKNYAGTVLVLYGDTPLITAATLEKMLKAVANAEVAVLGMRLENPMGYGRLVVNASGHLDAIVECKDANAEQKKITLCNSGVIAVSGKHLFALLKKITPNNASGEYYFTDIVTLANAERLRSMVVEAPAAELAGINSRLQLAEAEHALQTRLRKQALENGVTLIDPTTVYFAADTKIAQDVIIHPNVVFGEGVTIETGAEIKSFSHIEGTHIGKNATVGPFARLRPGSVLEENAHVGNFVELKKTRLGKGAKANHLSYVGDADVGANANIGAGTITCNYDGINKYQTTIGEGAFIGSNTSLVAPVTVGKGAIVGAGSVITKDVEADALVLERSEQVSISGKAKEIRQKKQKK